MVEGAEDNFKVTTPADLARFEFELANRDRGGASREAERSAMPSAATSVFSGARSAASGSEEV